MNTTHTTHTHRQLFFFSFFFFFLFLLLTASSSCFFRSERWKEDGSRAHQSLTMAQSSLRSTSNIVTVDVTSNHQREDDDDDDVQVDSFEDPFTLKLTTLANDGTFYPDKVVVNRATLSKLSTNEVLHHPHPLKPNCNVYYRNIVPDMFIVLCTHCNRFFLDDIETHLLLEGTCAFCRNPMKLNSSLV